VVRLRKDTGFGAERLKQEFSLSCSAGAIKRIARQHGLVKPRKKKHKTKRDLGEVKKQWALFKQLSADTKYLQDIPFYWPQMKHFRLPEYQYTAREVVSGMTFTGYADELSKTYSTLLAERVSAHLAWHGVNLDIVNWQTDNGSEFLENDNQHGLPSTVRALGSEYHYIPVKAFTWQSDVETVHRLVEDEFFDREIFRSKDDFWRKLALYWYYFTSQDPIATRRARHLYRSSQSATQRSTKQSLRGRLLTSALYSMQYNPNYTLFEKPTAYVKSDFLNKR